MWTRSFKNISKKFLPKSLRNIVDGTYLIRYVRKFAGASVLTIESNASDVITAKFTFFGFISFIFWYSSYFYCMYKVHADDQTILRHLYKTKLKGYGDQAERFTNIMFVLYAMWKVPFDLSGSTEDMQMIVDIDKAIEKLGHNVDYSKNIHSVAVICLAQIIISLTRALSVWMSLLNLDTNVPIEKVCQMIFTDSIVFIITAQYCSYLLILRRRYKTLNNILNSIRPTTCSELFIRLNRRITEKPLLLKEKYICNKIKSCGIVYSMLYKATKTVNEKFGLVLLFTMLMTLFQIILYLYYFLEATVSGLFHDLQNYMDFLIYVFWQIGYAFSVILVCIYFSDTTVKEAQATSNVTHEIINSDLEHTVIKEAVHLSLQSLHQKPVFTAHGLFKLDYEMLLEGARSVTTFLVILLQFATDKYSK